jgi:hypothetical protein
MKPFNMYYNKVLMCREENSHINFTHMVRKEFMQKVVNMSASMTAVC